MSTDAHSHVSATSQVVSEPTAVVGRWFGQPEGSFLYAVQHFVKSAAFVVGVQLLVLALGCLLVAALEQDLETFMLGISVLLGIISSSIGLLAAKLSKEKALNRDVSEMPAPTNLPSGTDAYRATWTVKQRFADAGVYSDYSYPVVTGVDGGFVWVSGARIHLHGLHSESEIDGFFFDVEPFDTTLRLKVPDRQVTLSINVLERVSGETGRISLAKQLGAAAASGLWGSTPSVYPPMDRQRNREAQPASKSTVCLAAAGLAFTGSAAYVLLPQAFATAAIIITLAHFLTLLGQTRFIASARKQILV